MNAVESHLEHFRRIAADFPAPIAALRESAIAAFAASGFPTTRDEDWKYTNVTTLAGQTFRPAIPATVSSAGRAALSDALLDDPAATQLVFVNGMLSPDLCRRPPLPAGVVATDLASAIANHIDLLEGNLASCAAPENASFTALNTAFLRDGVLVHVPANTLVEAPIHVVFATIGDADPVVSHPRSLFVVDSGGSAVVIEQHIGLGDGSYWSNAVSEAVVGPNARLAHYKLQQESRAASHIATIAARQAADSTFRSHAVSLGGRLVRNDIATRFEQRGGECSFDGLYLLDGEQHVDHHTTIDHAQPQCTSDELYKGILGGRATAVFNGKVIVRPDAQKTDAHQMNKNLLLSERAEIDTKPQLEIFADDVKCSHGATVGRLDDESLFFLRSRGIDENEARNLLTFAFANEIVERIDVAPWRERLESLIRDRFASGSLDSINPEQKNNGHG